MNLLATILIASVLGACGTEMGGVKTVNNNSEVAEEEIQVIEMCQLEADPVKPLDFAVDGLLIYWMACYDFRPCDPETPVIYTEEEIEDYAIDGCSVR